MSLVRDLSASAVVAGFVTVLVGFASAAAIVFQAAGAAGASAAQVSSWKLALGVGMGLTCILLSLRYRVPVVTAWSTSGAALLVTSAAGLSIEEATGAFLVPAALITLVGFSGWFERAMDRIPVPIASGMLAGVLLRLGVALPLFVVTMASQNVPGVAVIRASGYTVPISPIIGWTGLANLALAPFGGFTLNLAAITAAICMGREAHEDPRRRYVAAMAAGLFYAVVGIFGATVVALLTAFPPELVAAIAGLALLATIGNGLALAVGGENQREPALLTFLVTASGLTLGGIGSAFWGLAAGVVTLAILRAAGRPAN
jgi:benzoate membrane transport protein